MFSPPKTPSHVQTTTIKGKFHIPENARSSRKFIVPDDVVEAVARRYDLAAATKRGSDPMCGVGTIPRVILGLGGDCDANEIDQHQHATSMAELPAGATITLADCTNETFLKPRESTYDYIYTSISFAWFKDYPIGVNGSFARAFRRMLKPHGLLIIDCDDVTTRGSVSWPLASYEIDYFSKNGFGFKESTRYVIADASAKETDSNFTELAFIKI